MRATGRVAASLAALAVVTAACAQAPTPGLSTTSAGTVAVDTAPSTSAAVATFVEVDRRVTASTALATATEEGVELCGVPIDRIADGTGPRTEVGTTGMLRAGNAPTGVRLRRDEVVLSDGAVLSDVMIPDGSMLRVEPGAAVTIERITADDAWVFMEEGATLTMRDSDIRRPLSADNWYVLDGHGDGGLLEFNRFSGGEAATIFLRSESSNWTIRNNDVSGGEDGFKPGGSGHVIESNWIHDLATGTKLSSGGARHSDGLQLQGANIDLSIRCNFIDSTVDGANAAIIIKPDLGDIATVEVVENAMAGGAYTLFSIVAGTDYPMTDVKIGGNVFFAGTGYYGSIALDNDATVLADNVTENAEPVTAG